MHFQLAHLLALIPFVAGMAIPEPASNAAALAALPSHTTVTLADGSTCLAVALYYETFYANSAGVPGCGVQRLNRLAIGSSGETYVVQACGSASCHWLNENSGYSYAGQNVCQTSC